MVMHARKLPRLNDGYFDRNQTHPYQNANKFSKNNYNDRYSDKVRDSPSNGTAFGRSDSPDGRPSPRDRPYHKSSYSQRLKERDKDRERYNRDSSKSPTKERSKPTSGGSSGAGGSGRRDHPHTSSSSSSHRSGAENNDNADHRSNHERTSNTDDKEKERRLQVGDWSEHISSSGKKYYYNCKTEVSQWEKPKEWMEWEKQQGKPSGEQNRIKDRGQEKAGTSGLDKHSSERGLRHSSGHYHHHSGGTRPQEDRYHAKSTVASVSTTVTSSTSSSSTSAAQGTGGTVTGSAAASSSSSTAARKHAAVASEQGHRNSYLQARDDQQRTNERSEHKHVSEANKQELERRAATRKSSEDSQAQDMDISPSCTPPSGGSGSQVDLQMRVQTPVTSHHHHQHHQHQHHHHHQPGCTSQQTPPPVTASLANLPKLLSQLAGNKSLQNLDKTELSAQEVATLQTLQTALLLTRQVSLAQTSLASSISPHSASTQPDMSPFPTQKSPSALGNLGIVQGQMMHPERLSSRDHHHRSDALDGDKNHLSPASEYSQGSSRMGSPTSSICSVQGIAATGTSSLASAALRPAVPTLTPSLANYFRDDLIGHVMGWQADHAERQAGKYSEEAHNIGSLNCTKVSAELKMARSLVRVAEIQATLQEQRILFLRQQIKELEEWKTLNSFMSDS